MLFEHKKVSAQSNPWAANQKFLDTFCESKMLVERGGGWLNPKISGHLLLQILGELASTKVFQEFQQFWLLEKCPKSLGGRVRPVLD